LALRRTAGKNQIWNHARHLPWKAAVVSFTPPFEILYEDNHVLAVNKPAGLATIGVGEDEPSLAKLAKAYLKRRYDKPGNVYLGVMSRLDAVVSGVVLLARTSKAAARLTEQFRSREAGKIYWAIVAGQVEPEAAECVDWLAKDDRRARMEIVAPNAAGAQEGRLRYRLLRRLQRATSLLEVELLTGRKHQIRVQLAGRGLSILGDKKYGASMRFPAGIALHSRQLTVRHPTRDELLTFVARPPASWRDWGISDIEGER
jgi:23S rRNA pseudouridine1911/1915/1917 synthase